VWEFSQVEQLLQLLDDKRLVEESNGMVDNWIWRDAESTIYTVKTTYNHLKGVKQGDIEDFLTELWKLKTLPSTQVTTWSVLTNTIATKDNLMQRSITLVSNLCPLCGEKLETVNHLFFKCKTEEYGVFVLSGLGSSRCIILMQKCISCCLSL